MPNIWKTSHVIPIHKKGPTSSPSNYRQISFTCICCRVLEKIINEKILQHLISHNVISPQQHGFRPLKSTTTNLLECVYDWTSSQQRRQKTDIIYFGIQKAFDSVSHSKLLHRVQSCGITGNLLQWLSNFLYHRKQHVLINETISGSIDVTSGVPQGSVLGPMLFLIYINDVVNSLPKDITIKLFAGDFKLNKLLSLDDSVLQRSINSPTSWSRERQLNLAQP